MRATDTGSRGFDDSLVIRLLDHQIVDGDGRLLGKVDDLSLREEGADLVVDGLMVGPAALTPRYPGVLGRWSWAVWRRLNDPDDPGVAVVPLTQVEEIGSDVRVDARAREVLLRSFGLENWLRRHLISRIPGAKGGERLPEEVTEADGEADDGADGMADSGARTRARLTPGQVPERGGPGPAHRLTELLAMDVVDASGASVGRVTDVRGRTAGSGIRLTELLAGPRLFGSSLGYSSDEQDGPRAISWLVGRLHRSAHWRDWSQLRGVDWDERRVEVTGRRSDG